MYLFQDTDAIEIIFYNWIWQQSDIFDNFRLIKLLLMNNINLSNFTIDLK